MIVIIDRLIAPRISSFKKTGSIEGGIETKPLNWTTLKRRAKIVTVRTPIKIAPAIFLTAKTEINRNPTVKVKNALRPIPGAKPTGQFAKRPIKKQANAAARQVPTKIAP